MGVNSINENKTAGFSNVVNTKVPGEEKQKPIEKDQDV